MTTVGRITAVLLVLLQVALFVWMVAIWSWVALLVLVMGTWTFFSAKSIWENCNEIDRIESRYKT